MVSHLSSVESQIDVQKTIRYLNGNGSITESPVSKGTKQTVNVIIHYELATDEVTGEAIFMITIVWVLAIMVILVALSALLLITKIWKAKKNWLSSEDRTIDDFSFVLSHHPNSDKQIEPRHIILESNVSGPQSRTTFLGSHQPFVNQFSGRVGFYGGEISSPKSAVKIIVPLGAIPKERGEQVIYVNVALDGTQFNLKTKDKEIQVCPVVECLAPGLDVFRKPVTIKVPHRADIRSCEWNFTAKYSNDALSRDTKWKNIPLKCKTDEDYVFIKTNHFTSFSCFGCGIGGRLKLTGVVYGNLNRTGNSQQLNFRVYVCSSYRDALQQLEQSEGNLGPGTGRIRSQPKPLILRNRKDIEIKLKSNEEKNWPWKLKNPQTDSQAEDAVQVIMLEHCYSSNDTPPSVDFRCVPKDNHSKNETDAETVFEISQIRKDKSMMAHVHLVAQDFSTHHPVFNNIDSSCTQTSFSNQVPAEVLHEIVSDLIVARGDVLTLFRILGLDEANIQSISHGCRSDLKEQIYAMISKWESSRPIGERATVQEFIQGCEKCQLNAIADKLRGFLTAS